MYIGPSYIRALLLLFSYSITKIFTNNKIAISQNRDKTNFLEFLQLLTTSWFHVCLIWNLIVVPLVFIEEGGAPEQIDGHKREVADKNNNNI